MYINWDIEKLQIPKVFLDKPSQRLPINTYILRTCIAIDKADSYIYKGDSYNILIGLTVKVCVEVSVRGLDTVNTPVDGFK